MWNEDVESATGFRAEFGDENMISRNEFLRSTEEAYANVRAEEIQLDAELRSQRQEAKRIRRERLAQFRALAQLKFDHIKRGELITKLDAAEQQAKELIQKTEFILRESSDRRRIALEALDNAQQAANEQKRSYDMIQAELQSFEQRMNPSMALDPEWIALRDRMDFTRQTLEYAEKKADLAVVDRERKRLPYEQDELFMYLWRRKFGTPDYRSGPFVRFFDSLVANLVDYSHAFSNFSMMIQIPDRLVEHVGRVKKGLEQQQQDLESFRREWLLKAGGRTLLERADESKSAVEAAAEAVREAQENFEEADREYANLVNSDDEESSNEAIEAMATSVSRSDLSALYAEVERVGRDEDRAIVRRIDELTRALFDCDQRISALRRQLRTTVARRLDVQRAHSEATIADVLGGIVAGAVGGAVLGQILQTGQGRAQGPLGAVDAMARLTPPSSTPSPPIDVDAGGGFSSGGGF